MSPTLEKTDPRVARTRQGLQDALEALLRERPYAAITVGDVTSRAGVNRATFYAHYTGKGELFGQLVGAHLRAVLEAHAPAGVGLSGAALRATLRGVCVFMSLLYADGRETACAMEGHVERQVHEQLTAWFAGALGGAAPRANARLVSRDVVAALLASGVYTAAASWGREASPPPLERYVDEALVFLTAGLSAAGFGD